MAAKTKAQLTTDIGALPTPITDAALSALMIDMVDSWEDLIAEYTTAARNALTPFQGQKIFNTTNLRVEIYSDATGLWLPASQKTIVATDCSGNPNYPEAGVGDQLICSVAGKIGGASGKSVYVGDIVYCIASNAGGTEASVGTSWQVCYSADASDAPDRFIQISLSSAQILAINATPQILVAAPGAGKLIVPLVFISNYTFVSAAYAANTNLRAYYDTGTSYGNICDISAIANRLQLNRSTDFEPLANKAIKITEPSGAPTTGDGTLKIGLYYKIHTLT